METKEVHLRDLDSGGRLYISRHSIPVGLALYLVHIF